ncbi:MAG: DNA repair protein RadA [Rhodospirillales bacterium]|nr:DNA repair protein RadA [Rhodospirillales bacterium]MDP6774706.1 DNA repair protein RadA [Rhodospirillales bacterium]
MARKAARFVCQQCGASHAKWGGRCDSCGGWNTLVEEAPVEATPRGLGSKRGRKIDFVGLDGDGEGAPRRATGIKEFDRVCGGGLVAGSALLVGGDPGIGKSTLLLQVAAALSGGLAVAYVSGEEAVEQMRMRARRLGLAQAGARLATGTSVRDIAASVDVADGPGAVVIDSIQTMYVDTIDAAPGTVTQVRASAQELIRLAKRRGFILFLVGHVTKEGLIAGPRVLEHMVDTVLYFEGERGHQYRILRAVKNRYGATDEIGVFEMSDAGLIEVSNPSALFLADRRGDVSGACVFPGMEGSRPVLVEIQSLIAPSALATPRRAVVGWDSGRLAMITAVLEARCGLSLASREVYLNVAGGLRIAEPAADLAVAAALASAASGTPVAEHSVVFGEVSLSGEVRAVAHADARLKEAAKLGFTGAIMPKRRGKAGAGAAKGRRPGGLEIVEIDHLRDLLALFPPLAEGRATGGQGGQGGRHGARRREPARHG